MVTGAVTQTTASNTPTIASAATAIAANAGRLGWSIQNTGQNPLFVLLGTGATTGIFHVVLKASTGNDDGTGGLISQTLGAVYTGKITIAGSSPRYVALEMAP